MQRRTSSQGLDADALLEVLRTAVDQAAEAVLVTDAQLASPGPRIVFANRAFTVLTGYSREEVRGRTPRILQGTRTSRETLDALRRELSAGRPFAGTAVNYRKDGSEYLVEWSIAPVRDRWGDVRYFVAVQRDVTERERTRTARDEADARFRAAIDAFDEAVLVLQREPGSSGELCLTELNQPAEAWLGASRRELLGRRLGELALRIPPGVHEALRDASERGETLERRVKVVRDGEAAPSVLRVYTASRGDVLVAALRDVTTEHRQEQHVAQRERLELVGRATSGIVHDFNNLLTAMLGFASAVHAELDPSDPHCEDLSEIVRAANRAAALTRQLLALGREQPLRPRIIELAGHLCSMRPTLARLLGPSIRFSIESQTQRGFTYVDPVQLERVVINLAMNARDAMPEGGSLVLAIDVVPRPGNPSDDPVLSATESVQLTVRDTGVGIAPDVLPVLFEPYFTTKHDGHGLGLPTVREIVEQAGGSIEVTSELGRGTEFRVLLPRSAQGDTHSTGLPPRPRARRALRVLVVEEEDTTRAFIASALRRVGHQVEATAHPGDALLVAETSTFDVVVTDVEPPRLTGAELVRRLRERSPGLAAVFTSGRPDAPVPPAGQPRTSIVQKPFPAATLIHAVDEAVADPPSSSRDK